MSRIAQICFAALFALCSVAPSTLAQEQNFHQKIAPPRPKGADSFDFLIGSWSCRFQILQLDGNITKGECGWEGRLAAGGHAIIDEYWHRASIGKSTVLGVNIRTYDSATGKWNNRWFDALNHRWLEFEATPTAYGIEGVHESEDNEGRHLVRFRFLKIQSDSFEYQLDRSRDEGVTWEKGVMHIWVSRRTPAAPRTRTEADAN